MILATQGLGHGMASLVVLGGSCGVLLVALIFLVLGSIFLTKTGKINKCIGVVLIVASIVWTVGCYCVPALDFRLKYGSMPLDDFPHEIEKGMTMDQVRGTIGPPHEVRDGDYGGPNWVYHCDAFGLKSSCYVYFDKSGIVHQRGASGD